MAHSPRKLANVPRVVCSESPTQKNIAGSARGSEHLYSSLNEERPMAQYWERGSGGEGLEVHCLVLFGSTTVGLNQREVNQHESQFGGFSFFCFFVVAIEQFSGFASKAILFL